MADFINGLSFWCRTISFSFTIGIEHNKATRWLAIPFVGEFQPSEITKVALIIAFSYYAAKMGDKIRTYRGLLPFIGAFAVVAGFLALQPHMSAIVIMFIISLSILFVAGIKIWYFFPIGIAGIGAFAVAYQMPIFNHVRERIAVWLDPFIDLLGQAIRQLIALLLLVLVAFGDLARSRQT